MWHEDFGDEPSVEERMPFGISPEEMLAVSEEAMLSECCEFAHYHSTKENSSRRECTSITRWTSIPAHGSAPNAWNRIEYGLFPTTRRCSTATPLWRASEAG